jgi:signal transduction histidine kinase
MPRLPNLSRRGLHTRLLASHLRVVAVGAVTLFISVDLVAPHAFDAAMGHAMDGMDEMMGSLVRAAFKDAVQTALLIATLVATAVAFVASLALSSRFSRPIARLAAASRRIAAGRYAERVPVSGDDELGELAASFNTMATSLEVTERRRIELVGDVAHELRTPLTTLDGYLEGLEDGVIEASPATWTLLRGETRRLARLVGDLQELWRAEARQLPLAIESIDGVQALEAAAGRFRKIAAEREVSVEVGASIGPVEIRADRERLAQVLDNLIGNAVRYSDPGTSVAVGAVGSDREVIIFVSDRGPGLTREQLDRVFERFYRVERSRSRALGGSGIGLAIVKALVDLMGGRVWAESGGPGQGSTFRVAMPRAE